MEEDEVLPYPPDDPRLFTPARNEVEEVDAKDDAKSPASSSLGEDVADTTTAIAAAAAAAATATESSLSNPESSSPSCGGDSSTRS